MLISSCDRPGYKHTHRQFVTLHERPCHEELLPFRSRFVPRRRPHGLCRERPGRRLGRQGLRRVDRRQHADARRRRGRPADARQPRAGGADHGPLAEHHVRRREQRHDHHRRCRQRHRRWWRGQGGTVLHGRGR